MDGFLRRRGLMTEDVTGDGWEVVARISTADLIQYGLDTAWNNNTYPYCASRSNRVSYPLFIDVSGKTGYIFKAEWSASVTPTSYGINSYNTTAMTKYQNKTTMTNNTDTKSHGWYDSGTEFTMETTLSGQPIETIRINFSRGSSHTTNVTPSQIGDVVIYCRRPS